MQNLEKNYDPSQIEDKIYKLWTDNECFKASVDPEKEPYTIVIPPPNITGQLHMGHALDNTLQDILIRYKRMSGYATLWLPGTDHASIATEAKIVEAMRKEGLTKEDLGRDGFLERAWKWKETYGGRIIEQLKKLGSSCDWSRERFTLDEGCSEAVQNVFLHLYEKGLIYRGERIINWCPHCRTSISDAEVEFEEQNGHFWHLRYPFEDGSGYLELATTRPETLLGDTAVAVNPKDERYKDMVGKNLVLPLVGRLIPVIADDYVEQDFGTGVVKITPAHDPNDFEVGRRHNLEIINVMTDDAKITADYPKYAGMDRYEARKAIVADLQEQGFLVRVEDYTHNVGTCYRCGTTVEPRVSLQWFVKMGPLAGPAIDAVRNGDIKFVPERFEKNYFYWMENIRDWCISRQLWWGHRIPAYYCDDADCGEMVVSRDPVTVCPKCGKPMHQDPDTLDTWFSSALWPFSTLGWPKETEDLKFFYPTSTLVTGYDIITFWVSRMIFSGLEYTGKAPFDTVLIHGLVRDAQGRKMSKSLGNGIDPLEIIRDYGADALRFTLITGNSPGNDMRFSTEGVEASRNFANKLWNATRFALTYLTLDEVELPEDLLPEDKWILHKLNHVVADVRDSLEKYELGIAAQKLYDFVWDDLCDWYIELIKPRLFETNTDESTRLSAQQVIGYVLVRTLELLHPFMPYITEELYHSVPHIKGMGDILMLQEYPSYTPDLDFPEDCEKMGYLMDLIKQVRQLRQKMGVPFSRKTTLYLVTEHPDTYRAGAEYVKRLASASEISFEALSDDVNAATVVTSDAKVFIPLGELVDVEKEKARLEKEKSKLLADIARIDGKLNNPGFLAKAPEKVVNDERAKREVLARQLANVEEVYNKL
ncbi:MAG: valine--tRNA ligase [Clostridia bacterium]|nr:valine--tRNA ligase [Clostridia bacterium]MBQ5821273.1 valine--tRNA ligase [Clostridia bacterium]